MRPYLQLIVVRNSWCKLTRSSLMSVQINAFARKDFSVFPVESVLTRNHVLTIKISDIVIDMICDV
ncbi:hypothetical protein LMG28138_04031 [Pararobbsia alpina]|uniref:Uncharacterized protein n=1 Tax=Pararobbsia alpina TaxID=621374 RepID=A0A6S7D545_9BURK|nr:hypothetical protein LMG28138_04031 [Pararobbsia alpina]